MGSHRWGKSFLPKKFVGVDYEREGEALDTMPDIDARRGEFEIASFDMAPGDAIAFHFPSPCTAHPGNASKSARRRAFAHRWVGDDVPLQAPGRRGLAAIPRGASGGCATRDPLQGPEFPLVWSVGR